MLMIRERVDSRRMSSPLTVDLGWGEGSWNGQARRRGLSFTGQCKHAHSWGGRNVAAPSASCSWWEDQLHVICPGAQRTGGFWDGERVRGASMGYGTPGQAFSRTQDSIS